MSKSKESNPKVQTPEDMTAPRPDSVDLMSELQEEKRKRTLIAQEAAATEEVSTYQDICTFQPNV